MSVAASWPRSTPLALRLEDVQVWRWHAASGSRKALLDGIGWEVGFGERWALLGPNGAGKTTLLTLAGAVEFASRGTVEILGETMGAPTLRGSASRSASSTRAIGRQFAPLLTVRQVIRTGATATIGYFAERLASSISTAPTACSAPSASAGWASGGSATARRASANGP